MTVSLQTVQPEAVQQELERICAHPLFANAPMLKRFLRFAVEKTLAGSPEVVKEYTIGSEVLGRGSSFDPSQSSIVRTQAFNIRSRLNAYYQEQGANAPLRIIFSPGTYTPTFAGAQVVSEPEIQ